MSEEPGPSPLGIKVGDDPRAGGKSSPHKNRAEEPGGKPWPFHLYLILGALAAWWGWRHESDAAFFVALGLLALAEIVGIRGAWDTCAARARKRMEWPPTEPPLREGASQEEVALAWADIACRAQEAGSWERASQAWRRCEEALKVEGSVL